VNNLVSAPMLDSRFLLFLAGLGLFGLPDHSLLRQFLLGQAIHCRSGRPRRAPPSRTGRIPRSLSIPNSSVRSKSENLGVASDGLGLEPDGTHLGQAPQFTQGSLVQATIASAGTIITASTPWSPSRRANTGRNRGAAPGHDLVLVPGRIPTPERGRKAGPSGTSKVHLALRWRRSRSPPASLDLAVPAPPPNSQRALDVKVLTRPPRAGPASAPEWKRVEGVHRQGLDLGAQRTLASGGLIIGRDDDLGRAGDFLQHDSGPPASLPGSRKGTGA